MAASLVAAVSFASATAQSDDQTVRGPATTEKELYDALHPSPPTAAPLPPGVHMRGAHRSGEATAAVDPSVALSINFTFGSAEILPDSRELLMRLAHVMTTGDLSADRFEVVGHTDAAGTPGRNMALSVARAHAVRDYLVESGGVAENRLVIVGKGQTDPLNLSDPLAPENRRVEIVNLGS